MNAKIPSILLVLLAALGAAVEVPKKLWVNDVLQHANLNNSKGIRHLNEGRYKEALDEFAEAVSEYQRIDAQEGLISALQNMGQALFSLDRDEEAQAQFKESERRSRLLGYRKGEADSFHRFGLVLLARRQYDEAIATFSRSLDIYKALADKANIAQLENSMGLAYLRRGKDGDVNQAEGLFSDAVKINQGLENWRAISANYVNLANCWKEKKDYDRAIRQAMDALSIDKQLEDLTSVGISLNTISVCFEKKGDRANALWFRERAFENGKALGLTGRMMTDLDECIRLAKETGDASRAAAYEGEKVRLTRPRR